MDFAGCFIKFGELEHLQSLYHNGLLYCNPITYFTEIEDQFLRGDDLENVVEMKYMDSGEVILSPVGEEPSERSVKMPFNDLYMTSRITEPFGNLFCLTAINVLEKPFGETFSVNARVKEFGSNFLLIHDSAAFLQRVKRALDSQHLRFKTDMVSYVDFTKYSGRKSVFQKDARFAYQQEWRLFIENNKSEPLKIEIGSLEDIAILGDNTSIEHLRIIGKRKDEETITILSNLVMQNGEGETA